MRKGFFVFVCSIICTYTSWALPLNLKNVQECKQMVKNFISDKNTGYKLTVIHMSGGGMVNDPNYISFEVDDEGEMDINIHYVQRMYFQIIRIIIEKKEESDFSIGDDHIGFRGVTVDNVSVQDYSRYFKKGHSFLLEATINDLFESLGY